MSQTKEQNSALLESLKLFDGVRWISKNEVATGNFEDFKYLKEMNLIEEKKNMYRITIRGIDILDS